jgi:hypothetical protein
MEGEIFNLYNTLDKEHMIVSGILSCNNEIRRLQASSKLFENLIDKDKVNIYKYNMMNLYCEVANTNLTRLNESFISSFDYIKNNHDNYYAYFNKINDFLSGYELPVQQSLNESLEISDAQVKNPTQLNIETFKQDLKAIILKLESINDIQNLDAGILKIKALSKIPLYVYGYNIMNNDKLIDTLLTYSMKPSDIKMIVYDGYNKGISFVANGKFIFYDLKTDSFNAKKTAFPIDNNLFQTFKNYTQVNNLVELYFDPSLMNLKYTNNVYNDEKYANWLNEKKKSNVFRA